MTCAGCHNYGQGISEFYSFPLSSFNVQGEEMEQDQASHAASQITMSKLNVEIRAFSDRAVTVKEQCVQSRLNKPDKWYKTVVVEQAIYSFINYNQINIE